MRFSWDTGYLASPGSTVSRTQIDNEIRDFKYSIREREELEHLWGGDVDSGRHIPGGTTVGSAGAGLPVVTTQQTGSMFFKIVGTDYVPHVLISGAWVQLSTADHATLQGLTDNDHPDLLLKTGGILTGNLNMNGHKAVYTGVLPTTGIVGSLLLMQHESQPHTNHTNADIATNAIALAKLNLESNVDFDVSGTIPDKTIVSFPATRTCKFLFYPQVYITSGAHAGRNITICCAVGSTAANAFGLCNNSGTARTYRVRVRGLLD
jgi:hypothetical protein